MQQNKILIVFLYKPKFTNMKRVLFLTLAFVFGISLFAQKTVDAKSIIDKLNKGESIELNNVTIQGDLIFANLEDKDIDKKNGKEKTITYHVRTDVVFNNCTFTGMVEAYRYDEGKKTLHTVEFEKKGIFTNCKFE